MSVRVETETGFSYGAPEVVFEDAYYFDGEGAHFDIGADGRFLMIKPGGSTETQPPQITVVLHWFEELLERVPLP